MAAVTARRAALAAVLMGIAPGPARGALIEGLVLAPGGRPAAALVCAWRGPRLSPDKAVACAATDGKGIYRLRVPAGTWYLAARGDDGGTFAFLGANPLEVAGGYRWVPLFLTPAAPARCRVAGNGGISGEVTFDGAPLAQAMVSVYPFGAGAPRGMGMLSGSSDAGGRFSFDLEPGRYTVVARKRKDGGLGPLAPGDLFCYPATNPLRIRAGERCEIRISCYPRDDIGHYLENGAADPRGRRFPERRKASLAAGGRETTAGTQTGGTATVRGHVRLPDGTAVAGLLVSAYPARGQGLFEMHLLRTRPAAMTWSDAAGLYRLRLPGGGMYYLQARQTTGEAPRPGELYGLYCGIPNHSLAPGPGDVREADITVARIMPGHSRERGNGRDRPAAVTVTGPALLREQVIRHDTVWRGEITVDGVIVVAAGARLTILPGTTVRFVWRDRNHDDVGDGEIRVLGEIRARGTGKRPVRFMAARPGPMRWAYLMIYASSGNNVVRGCRFSDAFSGVQVHFSTAVIEDCVFSGNNEGLRFGRADITVRNNRFTANNIGIRFTRMEGPASIRGNLISRNTTGMFLVPSGQNTTDFFNPERSGRPWNTGRLVIRGNTIAENREYDIKLGAKQMWDLDARGNRWSLGPGESREPRVFDHGRDPQLGVVRTQETGDRRR